MARYKPFKNENGKGAGRVACSRKITQRIRQPLTADSVQDGIGQCFLPMTPCHLLTGT